MAKKYAEINQSICVACGECVRSCPRGAVIIENGCYASVDTAKCIGCGLCAKNCPGGCIEVMDREQVNR